MSFDTDGITEGEVLETRTRLTHRVPAGPKIVRQEDGDIVSDDADLRIRWKKVTKPLIPGIGLGPVKVVGYHTMVADVTQPVLRPGDTNAVLDADLSANETSLRSR